MGGGRGGSSGYNQNRGSGGRSYGGSGFDYN